MIRAAIQAAYVAGSENPIDWASEGCKTRNGLCAMVLLKDSGSANGTFLSRGGAAGPWTVVPREPGTPLRPGDRVRLGKRQLLFDRYHVRSTPLQATGRGTDGPHR